ncbi:MAG: M48 family metalloprotease [Planctomycetes bacterium]|nr:M48 family metalloprotease [Planctomycetota bacterium]
MQVLILGLVILILVHDELPAMQRPPADTLSLLSMTLTAMFALAILYWAACRRTMRRLATESGGRALRRMDRFSSFYRFAIAGIFALSIYAGLLDAVRRAIGNRILLDELAVLAPPLLMFFWAWFCYYPIDRRLREAALIRRFDQNLPVHPVWTRGQFLLSQFRHQVLLVLAPLLLLMAWHESVKAFAPTRLTLAGATIDPRELLTFIGSVAVFILSPIMIRHLWDTEPLSAGELRTRLDGLCKHHRVGVRQLLLWRTFGGMINAAVMGIFAPVRYILLTDALLEMVPAKQVEAVMAHEIAHIRRHHMFWLMAAAMASVLTLEMTWRLALQWLAEQSSTLTGLQPQGDTVETVSAVAAVLCWAWVFGWVSRRYERQADTFAVQHLSRESHEEAGETGTPTVTRDAVMVMSDALSHVADLNHISVHRKSWRHGSIAWRQDYLQSLVGLPVDDLPIDHQVRWVNRVALLLIAAVIVMAVAFP